MGKRFHHLVVVMVVMVVAIVVPKVDSIQNKIFKSVAANVFLESRQVSAIVFPFLNAF